ncbi:MAG: LysE family translocator [Thermoactinomyces sp.]
MDLNNIIYFLLASITLTLMPGPDIIFVITLSMTKGVKKGVSTALGLCTGLFVHTAAAAIGISAVIYHSALAFQILKYAGALYLFYLAWQALKKSNTVRMEQSHARQGCFTLYKRGIWMNLLNPKVSVFFLAFLPQFVDPEAGSVSLQMIWLGGIFILQALVVFTLVSSLSGYLGEKLLQRTSRSRVIQWLEASVYSIVGLRLVLLER